jgi:hypothetical protein
MKKSQFSTKYLYFSFENKNFGVKTMKKKFSTKYLYFSFEKKVSFQQSICIFLLKIKNKKFGK